MLEARGLRKAFGARVAVDGVSLAVERGRVLALLGPNGAGKTTTVSMLAGLVGAESGQVLVDERPVGGDTDPARRRIGLAARSSSVRSARRWSWSGSPTGRATVSPRTAAA